MSTPRSDRHITPITLAFSDIWYSVADPTNKSEQIELLKGVSGFAKPGTITALMGSLGAGKTTLMDVIAGRRTGGTIDGRVLLNGYQADDTSIRQSTGYCEQPCDTHTETATFREALVFCAFLRQGDDVPALDKYDTVEECLDLLSLRPIADKVVRGSSLEQLNRLSIGVELAAKQSILFLDEPTSGLDARAAKIVMDAVRKVADSGRTVVCTIHQPSWEVFQLFDSLLVLKRGGEMVYFGEIGSEAKDVVQFFGSIEGVAPCALGYNPATWMLEVIGAGVDNTKADAIDFVSVFAMSEKRSMLEATLNQAGLGLLAPDIPPLDLSKKRAASNRVQLTWLFKRFLRCTGARQSTPWLVPLWVWCLRWCLAWHLAAPTRIRGSTPRPRWWVFRLSSLVSWPSIMPFPLPSRIGRPIVENEHHRRTTHFGTGFAQH